jgi:hypothetical protein
MTPTAAAWFELHRETKRAEISLREALGRSLSPEIHRPEVVGAIKGAWRAAGAAGKVIHRAIATIEKSGNVIDMAGHKRDRGAHAQRQAEDWR